MTREGDYLHTSDVRTFARSDQALDVPLVSLKTSGQPHGQCRGLHAQLNISKLLLRARAARHRGVSPTHEGTIYEESRNNNRTNRIAHARLALSEYNPAGVLNNHSINTLWRAHEKRTWLVGYKAWVLDDSKIRLNSMYTRMIARREASAWDGRRTKLDDGYFYYKTITSKTIARYRNQIAGQQERGHTDVYLQDDSETVVSACETMASLQIAGIVSRRGATWPRVVRRQRLRVEQLSP